MSPNVHFVIVTHATRSAVTHQIAQLQLQPPTLRPDIRLSLLLPEPLPIGSANGGIISATHSGHSNLSPLILVHYIPESKVKLISLGALTRQRLTYNIGPDSALTHLSSISLPAPSSPKCLDLPTPHLPPGASS